MFPTVIVQGFSGLLVVLLVFSDVQGLVFEDDGGTEVCSKPFYQNESSRRWEGKFCNTDILSTSRYNKNPTQESPLAPRNGNTRHNMWRQLSRESREMDEASRGFNQNWRRDLRRVNNPDDMITIRGRWTTEFNRETRSADNLKGRQGDAVRSMNIRLDRTRKNQDRRSFGIPNVRSERTYADAARLDSRSYTRSDDVRSLRVARSMPLIHERRSSEIGIDRRNASPSLNTMRTSRNTRREKSSFSRNPQSMETRSGRFRISAPEHMEDDTRRSPGKATTLSREEYRAVPSRMNERRTESTRRFVGIRNERDIVNERRLSPGIDRSNSRTDDNNRSFRRGEESRRIVREGSNILRVYSSSRSEHSGRIPKNIRAHQRSEETERSTSSIPLLNGRNTVRATQERFRNVNNFADSSTSRGNSFRRSEGGQRGFERIREFGNDRRQRQNSDIRRRVSSTENRMRFNGIRVREMDTMEQRRAKTVSSRGYIEAARRQQEFIPEVRIETRRMDTMEQRRSRTVSSRGYIETARRQQEFIPEVRIETRRNGRDHFEELSRRAEPQRDFNSRLERRQMNGKSYRGDKMSEIRRLVDSKSVDLSRSSMRKVQARTRSDVEGIFNEINRHMNQKARFVSRDNNEDAKRSRSMQSGPLSSERIDNHKELYGGLRELVENPVFGNWHGTLQITLACILLGQLMFSRGESLKKRWFPGNWIKLQVF